MPAKPRKYNRNAKMMTCIDSKTAIDDMTGNEGMIKGWKRTQSRELKGDVANSTPPAMLYLATPHRQGSCVNGERYRG